MPEVNQPRRPARRVSELWLGGPTLLAASIGLALAAASAWAGSTLNATRIARCWMLDATGLPCPGCGLTRSLGAGLHGAWAESWHYHPFGLFILGLFFLTVTLHLLPRSVREGFKKKVDARPRLFQCGYVLFVVAFLGFGIGRALLTRFT